MLLTKAFIERLNFLGENREPFLFIIDFEGTAPLAYPLSELPDSIRFSVQAGSTEQLPRLARLGSGLVVHPTPFPEYLKAFDRVMHHLRQGNSYLVNLTFATPIDTDLSLDEIYDLSEAPYKLLAENRFVVFSPEPFIRISGGVIRSFPMKGTIDAFLKDAGRRLIDDPKESAEHSTIVDLIRNDLSMVADRVEVARYRYIEKIRTLDKEILQASSEIRGRLPDGYAGHIGNLLDALLPAGSISGAPKKRTLEIIREVEPEPRGYYTGVFGVFDGENLDSGVMIRFIEKTIDGMRYRSGGGITHLSDPAAEYREMLDKVYLNIARHA